MDIQQAIGKAIERCDLTAVEMAAVMKQIMGGEATPAQIGGFLVAMRMKGETVVEITAAVQVMRELATPVLLSGDHLVDIVGTGGDGIGTFNISTASAVIIAAAGGRVAKHGNRSVSSNSGAADVLEAAGVELDLSPQQIARCVQEVGVGFMFAVKHHGAMKHAIGPRRELGQRTLFNILGPLTNPAGVARQVVGVFSKSWLRPVAEVLAALGSTHVMVVHSVDGLDEISIAADTDVVELRDGDIREYRLSPEQFGLQRAPLESLLVVDAAQSLALIQAALGGEQPVAADILALNAGAGLYVAGVASDLAQGVALAQDVIASGQAAEKLHMLVQFTRALKDNETS